MISLKQSKTYLKTKLQYQISIIKNFATCHCEKLASIFNDCLKENKFPNLMKIAEISPVFKKLDNTSKDNYRPISTLSNFTKLFESILFTQLNRYIQNKFSKYFTGFWKNHNTQISLLRNDFTMLSK